MSQDPELLRRLLRVKDRMDAASQQEWPVQRLARVSGVSEAHFARSFNSAAHRPDLTIAVSEKRRQEEDGRNRSEMNGPAMSGPEETEVP